MKTTNRRGRSIIKLFKKKFDYAIKFLLFRKNERESRKYAANLEGIISNENTLQVDDSGYFFTLDETYINQS